jgi:hypothetical protein
MLVPDSFGHAVRGKPHAEAVFWRETARRGKIPIE